MNELSYYSQQSSMTDPGSHAESFSYLPTSISDLVRIVQGCTIHVYWAESYGVSLPPERQAELQLRSLEKRLSRTFELDPSPLASVRPTDKRLVGNCRDFTLLLVAMLRKQGIPARARCGFAAYFMPNHYEDHWVAEYWHTADKRWVMVDAQIDDLQRKALNISFNTLDVPRNQFIVAGKAWQMARSGQADPAAFGIFDMSGLWFIRGNLLRDLAALNQVEMLPWDTWGAALNNQIDQPEELAVLDKAAGMTAVDAPEFATIQEFYRQEKSLRLENDFISFVNGQPVPQKLAA